MTKDTVDSDNVPLQIFKTRTKQDESRDDDVCIGTILQTKKEEAEEEDLRQAMQRAWALLDANESPTAAPVVEEAPPVVEPVVVAAAAAIPVEMEETKPMISTSRIQTVPLKTLTTKIYIDDAKNHKVVQLTNLLTTAMVVQYLRKKGLLDSSEEWTLFEIDNDHGVERPVREWEIVLNIVSAWDLEANNALLVKKYSYHYTLTSECLLKKKVPPMSGYLSIEYKKGKWQKRYCFIKDNSIYHAKDNKGSATSVLCHLATYDVYTLLQPLKISPTPFVFAIRAQDRSSIFEKEGDYMRFAAVEKQEELEDWVLSIRCAKSNIQYQNHPNRVMNPLAPISLDTAETKDHHQPILRRHKSLTTRGMDERKRSLHRPRNPVETEETLIQIDDRVKFAKGSLLETQQTKITRSKSVREVSTTELKRKSTRKEALLRLDDSPEKFHSRELHGKHVKPLLNFDEK